MYYIEDIQRAAISPGNSTRSQPLTIEEELRNLQLKKSKVKSRNTPTSSDNETMSLLSQSVSQRAARRTDSETDSVRSGVFSDVRSVVSGRGRGLPPGQNLQIGRNKTETLRGPEPFVHRSSDTSSLSSSGRVGSTQVMQTSKGDSSTLSLVHDHQKPETDSEQNLHTSMGKRQGSLLSLSSGDGSVLSASLRSPMNGMLGRLMNSLVTPPPSVSQPSVSDSELLNSQPPSANYRPHHTDGSSAESVQRNIRTYTPSSLQRQQPSVDEYLSANIPSGSTQNPDSHKVPTMRSANSQVSGARSLSSVEMSSRKVTSPPSSLSSSHGKIRQGLRPAKKAQNIKDQMLDL